MKTEIISIRVPETLKANLDKFLADYGMSLSDCVRQSLEDYLEREKVGYEEFRFFYETTKFLFLVTWLFSKQTCSYDGLSYHEVLELKFIIGRVLADDTFPSNLKYELEKVYAEIISYCNDYNQSGHYFKFALASNPQQFNYQILIDFVVKTTFQNTI